MSAAATDVPTVEDIVSILEIDADADMRSAIQAIIATDRDDTSYAAVKLLLAEMSASANDPEVVAAVGDLRAKSNEIETEIAQIFNNECAPPPVEATDWRRRLEMLQKQTRDISLDNAMASFRESAEYLAKIVTFLLTIPSAREASIELLLDEGYVAMAARLWKKTHSLCVLVHRLLLPSTLIKNSAGVVALLARLEDQLEELYDELAVCWEYATTDRESMALPRAQQKSIRSSVKLSSARAQQVKSKVRFVNASRSLSPTRMPGAFPNDNDDNSTDETSFVVPDISMDEFERSDMSSSGVDVAISYIHFAVNCLLSLTSFLFTISQKSNWHIDWQARVNGILNDLSLSYNDATVMQRIGIAATGVALIGMSVRVKNWPRVLAIMATLGVGSFFFGTQTIVKLLFGEKDKDNMAQPPHWFNAYTNMLNLLANNFHWITYTALRENDFLVLIGATSLSTVGWIIDARGIKTEQTLLLYTRKKITAGLEALAVYQNRRARQQRLISAAPERYQQPQRLLLTGRESPNSARSRSPVGRIQFGTSAASNNNDDDDDELLLRELRVREEANRREQETQRRLVIAQPAVQRRPARGSSSFSDVSFGTTTTAPRQTRSRRLKEIK